MRRNESVDSRNVGTRTPQRVWLFVAEEMPNSPPQHTPAQTQRDPNERRLEEEAPTVASRPAQSHSYP